MPQIIAYLTFSGNCRQAMAFYKRCLGGKLQFQKVDDSPFSGKMSKKMKDCILHSTLTKGALILYGSDMVPTSGLVKGNAVSLSLICKSENEIKTIYKKLSTGGNAEHPIEKTAFGAMFGNLTDKFGFNWILIYNKENKSLFSTLKTKNHDKRTMD